MAADPDDGRALEAGRLELLGSVVPAALHDLANPLLALVGTLELLLEEPGLDDGARARLERARGTAEEIAELVRVLQRLVRERLEPEQDVDLGAFAGETAALAQRFSGIREVDCAVSVDDDAGVVRIRPAVLRQAVLALVLDGLRSTSPGGRVEVVVGSTGVLVSAGSGGGPPAEAAALALGARLEALPGQGAALRLGGR